MKRSILPGVLLAVIITLLAALLILMLAGVN